MRNLSRAVPFLLLILLISPAEAAGVSINEIAWTGTLSSYNDEWIELYNSTEQEISLEGWILKTADDGIKINLLGKISQNGFYLLERTGDETVPEIAADQIYAGALGNTGERLELSDGSGEVIDSVECQSGWAAGDNSTKQTMEKIGINEWQTSKEVGGTPRSQNSTINDNILDVEKITESNIESYPQGVIFSEILPSAIGQDEENEWIEILNQNNSDVELAGWMVEDVTGRIKRYIFPNNTIIGPGEYLIISRLATKITLNNAGDGLRLFWPNEEMIDSVDFGDTSNGLSYGLVDWKWQWISSPTPGTKNMAPAAEDEFADNTTTSGIPAAKDLIKNNDSPALAGISTITESHSFLLPLTISLGMAISAGAILLTIKKKLGKK